MTNIFLQGNALHKLLISFILLFSTVFAEPLSVEDAFKVNITGDKTQGININLVVDKSVYLYKDKLKVKVSDTDITEFLNFPKYEKHDEYDIYGGTFDLFIPEGLLKNFVNSNEFDIQLNYQGCSYSGFCYQPIESHYVVTYDGDKAQVKEVSASKIISSNSKIDKKNIGDSQQDKIAKSFTDEGKLFTIITFFGYGLLLSLTPCIFPMIPIVSSIIVSKTGQKPSAKTGFWISFVYVFFMSLAYALAGVLASVFGASVQGLLQIPSVIIGFSIIFVLLSFSMFGFYNIEMPKKIQNYINLKSEKKGGIIGVGIMGFLSALIVGPCVAAPLAGALLYIAESGDALFGGIALFVMSVGMGVPLLLIGIGSSKLLPKPGFWMEEIKRIFGFLMLAMAIWMLDRVVGSEISNALYGVLGVFFAVYLGAFNEAKDGAAKFLKSFGILIFVVSIILVSIFSISTFAPNLSSYNNSTISKNSIDKIEFSYISNSKDLEAVINSSQKPVMIDFWATWCVNCKELDEKTFTNPDVIKRLKDFTLIKIDVSDNTPEDIAMMRKYNVFGPPALIFYKDKKELNSKQLVGYVSYDEFLKHIEDI